MNEYYSSGKNTINEGKDITYLGMEIHQDKGTIHLTQEKYLQKVINEFKVEKTYDSPHDQTLSDLGGREDALEGREKDEFRS